MKKRFCLLAWMSLWLSTSLSAQSVYPGQHEGMMRLEDPEKNNFAVALSVCDASFVYR